MLTIIEKRDRLTGKRLLTRLREYFDNGYRDPELLYLGGRYAAALGLPQEARRFLDPLEKNIYESKRYTPYVPVALLLLQVLNPWQANETQREEIEKRRKEVLERLRELSPNNTSVEQLLLGAKKIAKLDKADELTWSGIIANDKKLVQWQKLAQEATQQYEQENLGSARLALENMLLMDGHQPAILRNLVTITSEQQDIEGYERYWRRYIKLLLWRIIHGEAVDTAWQDLRSFYTRVAEATDRTVNHDSQDKAQKALTRPGILSRWLEAHVGLIWLEAILKSRRVYQTNLDPGRLEKGYLGTFALIRYWFHLFYPEFESLIQVGQSEPPGSSFFSVNAFLPSAEAQLQLHFNPTQRLVTRFLKWHSFNFGLNTRKITVVSEDGAPAQERLELVHDEYAEIVVALAACVARLPTQYYLRQLKKELPEVAPGKEPPSVRQTLQDACSFLFSQFRLSTFLGEVADWAGLVAYFGDRDMTDKLSPTIRLFLAMGLCQVERPYDGLIVACESLPEVPVEELQENKQSYNLWRSVVHANIGHAIETKEMPSNYFAPIELISDPLVTLHISEASKAWFKLVRQQIEALPTNEKLEAVKTVALKDIDDSYTGWLINQAVEKSQPYIKAGEFEKARQLVQSLPDSPASLQKHKQGVLDQINEVEKQAGLQKEIEAAVEEAKKQVGLGNFASARRAINRLPNTPADIKKLKQDFLGQIDEAEKQAFLQKEIKAAVEEAKKQVGLGNFASARRAINRLPNTPADIKKLKQDFLGQIDEAEQQLQEIKREITRLEAKFPSMLIDHLVDVNNINKSNLGDYYGLLKAMEQQL
jgi:hypothetical protein